jgi:hypothetical protein
MHSQHALPEENNKTYVLATANYTRMGVNRISG